MLQTYKLNKCFVYEDNVLSLQDVLIVQKACCASNVTI